MRMYLFVLFIYLLIYIILFQAENQIQPLDQIVQVYYSFLMFNFCLFTFADSQMDQNQNKSENRQQIRLIIIY